MSYIDDNKRMPSKHHKEDARMVNWIKEQKKRLAREIMPDNRKEKFNLLLAAAKKYQRKNQYSYTDAAMNSYIDAAKNCDTDTSANNEHETTPRLRHRCR